MKYSLYKDLLSRDHILSHFFLNCISEENLAKIAEENKNLPEEKIRAREIEIEVKVNGISVNPKKFFDLFSDQYEDCVKREAKKMVKEQLSEKFSEISDKLDEYRNITQQWAEDINWQSDNLLIKKIRNKNVVKLKADRPKRYQPIKEVLTFINNLKVGRTFKVASIDTRCTATFVKYKNEILYYTIITDNPVVSMTKIRKVSLHRIQYIQKTKKNK